MIEKDELIRYFKKAEEKMPVIQLLNKIDSVAKNFAPKCTDFYDPYQISLCKTVLPKIKDVKYCILGGFEQAERKVVLVYPEFMLEDQLDNPLGAIGITGRFKSDELSHRDFLGAILGLGIKREKIGDIIVNDEQAYIVAFKEICEYILLNLDKISKYKVLVESIEFKDIHYSQDKYKLISTTVASLRLDAVASAGFGESRNTISKLMNNDRVKVNWKPINDPAYSLKEGDVISFKGKGRVILEQVGVRTKKDRYHITIKRMI